MGKFFLEVVQDRAGGYSANMRLDGIPVKGLPENVDYNALRDAIRVKTGVEILKHKDMIFQQDGRKNYAYIDTTQYRGEGKDCRVTLDEIKQGWEPKFDIARITVYKDAIGIRDDNDNLTEIEVPKKWLKDKLKADGIEDFEQWRNEYTADDTDDIARKALDEDVILFCSDKNFVKDNLYERAAMLVDEILSRPNGDDLMFLSNIVYSLSAEDLELSRDEVLRLTERLNDASALSDVAVLTAERVDAVRCLLTSGIGAERSPGLPSISPGDAKKLLLTCDLGVFVNLVDQIALDNQKFYAPDIKDLIGSDLRMVENAIAKVISDKPALEDVIKSAEKQVESRSAKELSSSLER